MKEFRLELNTPPQGVYFPGMMVTGTVVCETDAPKNYKQIVVSLNGRADVHWSESRGSGEDKETVHYSSHEQYLHYSAVLWDKNTANTQEGKFPVGVHRLDFSLQLSGTNLPASHLGTVGSIRYTIEARVVKDGLLKRDTSAVATLNVGSVVTIDRPELTQPISMEVQKTLCCFCCASAPIVITARIPRSGFCIGYDSIPIEVSVENGSNRTIRFIQVAIQKRIIYTAQGSHCYDRKTLQAIASQPITAHNSTVFRPEPIAIPLDLVVPSLTNCGIISVNYFLQVTAAISGTINPHIDFPIIIGNVPLRNQGEATLREAVPFQPPVPSQPYHHPPQSFYQEQFPQPLQGWNAPPPYIPNQNSQLPIGFVDPIKKA